MFTNLLIAAAGLVAPLALGFFPQVRLPAIVLEIVLGIVIGPSGLGWVKPDAPVSILALMGLAFLLFLSGLEIDVDRLRGRIVKLTALGFAVSFTIAILIGIGLHAGGFVKSPLFVAIVLVAPPPRQHLVGDFSRPDRRSDSARAPRSLGVADRRRQAPPSTFVAPSAIATAMLTSATPRERAESARRRTAGPPPPWRSPHWMRSRASGSSPGTGPGRSCGSLRSGHRARGLDRGTGGHAHAGAQTRPR